MRCSTSARASMPSPLRPLESVGHTPERTHGWQSRPTDNSLGCFSSVGRHCHPWGVATNAGCTRGRVGQGIATSWWTFASHCCAHLHRGRRPVFYKHDAQASGSGFHLPVHRGPTRLRVVLVFPAFAWLQRCAQQWPSQAVPVAIRSTAKSHRLAQRPRPTGKYGLSDPPSIATPFPRLFRGLPKQYNTSRLPVFLGRVHS